MHPHIQHDPRTKQHLKDAIYTHLYAPVTKAFRARLEALFIKNCVALRVSHKSFSYKGEFYHHDPAPFPRKAHRLAPALHAEMDAYLAELHAINTQEMPYVLGYINQVLNASNDFHDYLALLPDSLHPVIHQAIADCPCRKSHLTQDEVDSMIARNQTSIDLIRCRMVLNLIV